MTYENDEGQMSAELCKPDYGLVELLGDLLNDASQSDPLRHYILSSFANMCAELNENIKEAVLVRGRVLDIFATTSDRKVQLLLPWLLYNVYCQNVTLLLDTEQMVSTCRRYSILVPFPSSITV